MLWAFANGVTRALDGACEHGVVDDTLDDVEGGRRPMPLAQQRRERPREGGDGELLR